MLSPASDATLVGYDARTRIGPARRATGRRWRTASGPSERVTPPAAGEIPDDRVGVVPIGHFEYRTLGPGT